MNKYDPELKHRTDDLVIGKTEYGYIYGSKKSSELVRLILKRLKKLKTIYS